MNFQDLEYSGRLLIGRRDPRQAVAAGLFQIITATRSAPPRSTPELPREGFVLRSFAPCSRKLDRSVLHTASSFYCQNILTTACGRVIPLPAPAASSDSQCSIITSCGIQAQNLLKSLPAKLSKSCGIQARNFTGSGSICTLVDFTDPYLHGSNTICDTFVPSSIIVWRINSLVAN
ncbi:hypothetical protein OPV22_010558 [Ensete ventricosum]|uniref:Bifunctional inhibitor/plant lipid transfer protein/seed storage helical domain-containing protein n=1 Tax=Ensete ventricosum TaxID=4639 RepID=A0AAV8RL48_ENSVE|nr:hypothetical protein OPV22_010558 [Ensete ventricosum]